MTRESIYDESGELAASFCPTDTPLSDKGRAALEAVVRAVRADMAAELPAAASCCDLHNVCCEPPSELCCGRCVESNHPWHPKGVRCVLDARAAQPTTSEE